jgi:hypothetical protein
VAPRAFAIYTSGTPASRVQELTSDRKRILRAVSGTFAAPNSATHSLETVLRAARDFGRANLPITAVVVVSAGGNEMSPPPGAQVLPALIASHTILHVVERRSLRLEHGTLQRDDSAVFEALAADTHGVYVRGAGASVYASGLDAIVQQLDAEVVVTYEVPSGAPQAVNVRVRPPGIVVMAVPIDRAQ